MIENKVVDVDDSMDEKVLPQANPSSRTYVYNDES